MFMGGTTAVTRPLKVVIVGKETVGKTRCNQGRTPYTLRTVAFESTVLVGEITPVG
ncbi:unnamed protein product, partial [Ectocarpus sp. 8 AP-2014]